MYRHALPERWTAAEDLGRLWCTLMHDSPEWPIHGHYRCRTCGRQYPVGWDRDAFPPAAAAQARQVRMPSLRPAALPLGIILLFAIALTLHAGEVAVQGSSPAASLAFARYTAGLEQAGPWNPETVEIDASLPKFHETGRLRAIRRLLPFGKPEYQVLEVAGDQTVKQQVIARYLSGEEEAAAMAASSVAITPANYRFHYKGMLKNGENSAYIFLIVPRKKRQGLIKGELWLDGATGAAVRQSGYLVKNPSILVKRISVVRETALRGGVAEMRMTHLSIDIRLVGRAELTIEERPLVDTERGAEFDASNRRCTTSQIYGSSGGGLDSK